MAKGSQNAQGTLQPERVLGIPLGDMGWFASLLMGVAAGFAAFFGTTFLAIVAFLIYNTASHRPLDYALTYKMIGFPVGVLVLVVALVYLATLRIRRALRRG